MNYVLIRNGTVVNSQKSFISDVLIGNNKIIEVAKDISRPDPETPVIDATGKYVLPGAIDTNRAFSEFAGNFREEMDNLCRAEIIGGTTVMMEAIEAKSKLNCIEGLSLSKKRSTKSILDYGFHIPIAGWNSFSEQSLKNCFAREGIASFYLKCFTEHKLNFEEFSETLNKIKNLGLLLFIEITEPDIRGSGYTGAGGNYNETVKTHLKNLKLLLEIIAKTHSNACFLNISFQEELELITEVQKSNKNIYAELTMPCYIGEGVDFNVNENTILQGFPLEGELTPIPFSQFWNLLKNENFLSARPTFRVSNFDNTNTRNEQVFNRPDKYFVIKNALSVLYTAGVANGNIDITDFCNLISEKPAKITGLYPLKGAILPGSDADIVIWDPEVDRNLYCSLPQNLSKDNTSFKLRGKSHFVFINGVMVYDGEIFHRKNLTGKYIHRTSPF
ncbi:MAG: amidohydrolase family protein [Chlorobi bacterium]|nr:amidohydrolase family protein [Chlorobiota bacterium]